MEEPTKNGHRIEAGAPDVGERQLPLPSLNDDKLVEKSKKGRPSLSGRGREVVDDLWNSVYKSVGGDDAELQEVSANVTAATERLNKWGQEEENRASFVRLAELSMKKRLEAREMAEYKAEIEETSNSPWKGVLTEVREMYGDMPEAVVDNFAIRAIAARRKEIKAVVAEADGMDEAGKEHMTTHLDHVIAGSLATDLLVANSREGGDENFIKNYKTEDGKKGLSGYLADNYGGEKIHTMIEKQKEEAQEMFARQSEITASDIPEPEIKDEQALGEKIKEKLVAIKNNPKARRALQFGGAAILALLAGQGGQPTKSLNKATAEAMANRVNLAQESEDESESDQADAENVEEGAPTSPAETPTPRAPEGGVEPSQPGAHAGVEPPTTYGGSEVSEATPAVEQEEQQEQFMLGEIDLTNDFSVIVPEELANMIDSDTEFPFDVTPNLTSDVDETNTIMKEFNNWADNPDRAVTWRTHVPNNNVVLGHSGENEERTWPMQVWNELYETLGEELVGKKFKIVQNGNPQQVEIVGIQTIDSDRFEQNNSENYYPVGLPNNPEDPMFYRTDVMGFNEAAMQEGVSNIVACSGDYISPERGYEDRIIISVKPVEEHPSKLRSRIPPWHGGGMR